jgi:hypothetical protein
MAFKSLLASSIAVMGLAFAVGAHAYGSDYTLTTTLGGLQPEGTYANLTNPYILRNDGAWGSYVGPTGSGTFEVVNGAGDPTERFYYETLNLTAGTPYVILADIANNYSINAPVIQLVVDGSNVGASQTLTGPYGEFQNPNNSATPVAGPFIVHAFTYTPIVSGAHTVGFVDLDTQPDGNDFSFDPATSGLSVPEPASWALMTIGMFGLGAGLRSRRRAAFAV